MRTKKQKVIFKQGELVVLSEELSYVVSTASKRDLFEIRPGMIGIFLGYAETRLLSPIAVLLFEDVILSMPADRIRVYEC